MELPARTPEQLGAVLRARRRQLGLTQAVAGARVGLRPKTLSALEVNPAPSSIRTLFRALSALGLEIVLRPRQREGPPETAPEW
jgi:HTH-type transcriptional regulator / antitoxin HipB